MPFPSPAPPRLRSTRELINNPLVALTAATAQCGSVALVADEEALFSRLRDASGSVAALGPEATREVLTNLEAFGMAVPTAVHRQWPSAIVNLNASLFSMVDDTHRLHQKILTQVFSGTSQEEWHEAILAGVARWLPGVPSAEPFALLNETRRLARHIVGEVLLGGDEEGESLAGAVQAYFLDRRTLIRTPNPATEASQAFIERGIVLDAALRRCVRRAKTAWVIHAMRAAAESRAALLSEDQTIAHLNVLLMSSMEPIAVTLAWAILLLSERPSLRSSLRNELSAIFSVGPPTAESVPRCSLLNGIVQETLRVCPPNAIMLRVTRRPVVLCGWALPARCEVLLCPFALHRSPDVYLDPERFLPERWRDLRPSAFAYLPFGGGVRHCIGRHLAYQSMVLALACIYRSFAPVLATDQHVDWLVDVNLMPHPDVLVCRERGLPPARLQGPVREVLPQTEA